MKEKKTKWSEGVTEGRRGGRGGQGRVYKSSRGQLHLHSDMFLLLFRTAALSLLMAVAVVTQPGAACRREVPAGLIRDLWNRTRELVNGLPVRAELRGQAGLPSPRRPLESLRVLISDQTDDQRWSPD